MDAKSMEVETLVPMGYESFFCIGGCSINLLA